MIVVVAVVAALLAVSALLALVRVERGPSILDRALGLELLASALVGAIALEAAWSRRTETIPILVALSLVGFVGSVVLARFVAREPEEEVQVDDTSGLEAPVAEDPLDVAPHHDRVAGAGGRGSNGPSGTDSPDDAAGKDRP